MNLHLNRCTLIAALCILSMCATVSTAQQPELGAVRLDQLLKLLRPSCERLVAQIASQPEISLSLASKPINTAYVCTCAEMKFAADPRLQKFWTLSEKDMKTPIQSAQVKSYMTARMITSILECVSQELEGSLQGTELPQ